jgi:shikimate kinase
MKSIYLIGFMGVGKSTIGKKLATRLGYKYIDTDSLFEERYKLNINTFFNKYGEELFRQLEHEILRSLFSKSNCVISTGGGMPCYMDSITTINRYGISVYLEMKEKAILTRLLNSRQKRPLVVNLSESELLEFITYNLAERNTSYLKAHVTVPALSINLNTLVEEINTRL